MRSAYSLAALVVTLFAAASPAYAAFPGRNGQIALGGWVMNPDGTGLRPLVEGSHVRYSADGMRIVFTPTGGGIAVAKADGSDVQRLSTSPGDTNPTWSPDRRRI